MAPHTPPRSADAGEPGARLDHAIRSQALRALRLLVALAALLLPAAVAAESLRVTFHPAQLKISEVGWMHVRGAGDGATLEGAVAGRSLTFFPYAGGYAALVAPDLEAKAGAHPWRVAAVERGREPQTARGTVKLLARQFPVQRLTLPESMVDLDPETERRAVDEASRLRTLYQTITTDRLWRGRFTRPVAGTEPGTGFGARRIINGKPRRPHAGLDYAAPTGTPVVAANTGRVALIGEFFFPGRLVILDHGLGLYTLYFHLDRVDVAEGAMVERGHPVGTVGATGRATGPHLHFGAQLGSARVDPAALLTLAFD